MSRHTLIDAINVRSAEGDDPQTIGMVSKEPDRTQKQDVTL